MSDLLIRSSCHQPR